ncbi:hypothetical protein C8Q77DRAFT_1112847 [Trametes polyzona]|nr:hypothetical protein C8Q77DRAFT_1112847 [Trametes polyzona]
MLRSARASGKSWCVEPSLSAVLVFLSLTHFFQRMILIFICVVVLLAMILLCQRLFSPSSRAPRGPTHFTIPILSPFSSVVEHESSLFSAPQVGVTLLTVGGLLFVSWLRCSLRRK